MRKIWYMWQREREGTLLCFVTPCRHVAYDKSRYWDNRKTRRSLSVPIPTAFSSLCIIFYSPLLPFPYFVYVYVCVSVCFSISCQPYLVGDKLHHVLSRLCILQRIRRHLAQCFGCALYDQFRRMNLGEVTLVAAE